MQNFQGEIKIKIEIEIEIENTEISYTMHNTTIKPQPIIIIMYIIIDNNQYKLQYSNKWR